MNTEQTLEQFYDAEVAPALLEIAKKCSERNLPFFAVVEYDRTPEDFARAREDGDYEVEPHMVGETAVHLTDRMRAARRIFRSTPSVLAVTVTSGTPKGQSHA